MFLLPPLVNEVMEILHPEQEIYLVGGAVRDLLLGRDVYDLDFSLPAGGISLARKVANRLQADFMPLDTERDTGRVIVAQENGQRVFLDFAVFRGGSLPEDLWARDFTINAIAYDVRQKKLIDPAGGGADLRAGRIRACRADAFHQDPVRILRGVRLAVGMGFQIDKDTRKLMKEAASGLRRTSVERLRDEVFKILGGAKPHAAFSALEMLGILPHLMPELGAMNGVSQSPPHVYEVWTHTLAVLSYLEQTLYALRMGYQAEKTNDMFTGLLSLRLGRYRGQIHDHFSSALNVDRQVQALLFFCALYHDVCKPATRTVEQSGRIRFFGHDEQGAELAVERLRSFNTSNDEIERARTVIKHHMKIHSMASRLLREGRMPSRKAIYRFFRDTGAAGVDLVLLALADLRGTQAQALSLEVWGAYLDISRSLLENYFEKPEEVIAPPRLLDGKSLMRALNLQPGPLVGRLLEDIRENQAAGQIQTVEQALSFARKAAKTD